MDEQEEKKLIQSVKKYAKAFYNTHLYVCTRKQITVDDLTTYALIRIWPKYLEYDSSRGAKLETFVSRYAEYGCKDCLRVGNLIRGTPNVFQDLRKLAETEKKLRNEKEWTDSAVAAALGWDLKKLHSRREIQQTISSGGTASPSMDADDQHEIGMDWFPGSEPTPDVIASEEEVKQLLGMCIDKLPEREQLVIKLLFYSGMKQREIAVILGVSDERVRQIKNDAFGHLQDCVCESVQAVDLLE
ncbi:MAG: sigma-70 family RNA polymerase sigma factor [Sedimenticola sp.]